MYTRHYVMQMNQKKRLVYGSIVFIWIVVPIWEATLLAVSTGIQQGVCMWNPTYMTEVALKTTGISNSVISYQLPLLLMVFCYARVVYTLRTKVTYDITSTVRSSYRRLQFSVDIAQYFSFLVPVCGANRR